MQHKAGGLNYIAETNLGSGNSFRDNLKRRNFKAGGPKCKFESLESILDSRSLEAVSLDSGLFTLDWVQAPDIGGGQWEIWKIPLGEALRAKGQRLFIVARSGQHKSRLWNLEEKSAGNPGRNSKDRDSAVAQGRCPALTTKPNWAVSGYGGELLRQMAMTIPIKHGFEAGRVKTGP
ncbi:hypothetical protein Ddc_09194 [Ditylenchus destructor]|nr:hypothetical protein Ddc_09194 [Ditylenchus destructor]